MLKVLLLRSKKEKLNKSLSEIRSKMEDFKTREAELETAIKELSDTATDEERQVVEDEVQKFEDEKKETQTKIEDLEKDIQKVDEEIANEEQNQPQPENKDTQKVEAEKRSFGGNLMIKNKLGLTRSEMETLVKREDMKEFLTRTRELGKQKRSVTGGDLLVPVVGLEIIHSNIDKYSKLYRFVNVKAVAGKARQTVMGDIPEGVWTESVAKINEVAMKFTQVEVDGYKVASYIPVPNTLLEDSDINLATEVLAALGQGLGLALDKAILFGKGKESKMPTGIFKHLTDKASGNKITVPSSKKGLDLFKEIVTGCGKIKHATGEKFWAMNSTTHAVIMAESLGVNAAASVVAGMNNTMPVVGGEIVELEFIPDNVIIGGCGQRYLLSERAGTALDISEQCQFLEDNTVFRAKARYDGQPVFADSFVAFGLGSAPVDSSVTFAEDAANAQLPEAANLKN